MKRLLLGLCATLGCVAAAEAQDSGVNAVLMNPDGEEIGGVAIYEMAQGVRLFAQAEGLPEGTHAFHIHETGSCETPDFKSAGGHYNPSDASHGWDSENGPHAGDLPNVHVQEDGVLSVEYFTDAVTLGDGDTTLFDDDGSAIVIHEGADDYQTDPAGDAGPRIACGVIEQSQ